MSHLPAGARVCRATGLVLVPAQLEDGSAAHGIRYDSRHATGAAWAYWLRRVDDGHAAGT